MKIKELNNFKNAFRGIIIASKESSFCIMTFFGILVVFFGFYFSIKIYEMIVVLFLIGMVISIELINSQVERTLDIIQPEYDIRVKDIKDISAGAVLIASITSFIIGLLIFLPYILNLFNLWLKNILRE